MFSGCLHAPRRAGRTRTGQRRRCRRQRWGWTRRPGCCKCVAAARTRRRQAARPPGAARTRPHGGVLALAFPLVRAGVRHSRRSRHPRRSAARGVGKGAQRGTSEHGEDPPLARTSPWRCYASRRLRRVVVRGGAGAPAAHTPDALGWRRARRPTARSAARPSEGLGALPHAPRRGARPHSNVRQQRIGG